MPMINSFGVIGGDERMRYLAASIAADGYPVCAYGFENSGPIRGVAETSLPDRGTRSAVILLPLPATRDGETINGASCLVTGLGRIGKNLALLLHAMGAHVFVAARKKSDLMFARALGAEPLTYREITRRFDIIFNTVPARVIGAPVLAQQDADTLILELASAPGGIDRESAARLQVRVVEALSLPGRVAPKTAAEYIKEAVYNMLEE